MPFDLDAFKEEGRLAAESARRKREEDLMNDPHSKEGRELRHKKIMEKHAVIASHCRPASAQDYSRRIRAFIESGGVPSYYRDYPFDNSRNAAGLVRFWVAHRDFTLPDNLCGASAVTILVPTGVTITAPDMGHCVLIYDDGRQKGTLKVEVFSDT